MEKSDLIWPLHFMDFAFAGHEKLYGSRAFNLTNLGCL